MFERDRVDAMCEVARRVAASQAELLAAMAAVADEAVGVGFDADEVAFALHLPRVTAQREVGLARDLMGRFPAVFAALSEGRICLARARVFSEVLLPVQDDVLAGDIADGVLPRAPEWTAAQIRYRLLKALLAADPAGAAARMARSVEQRRLSLTANDDTTACLSGIYLPPAKAAAAFERVDAIARGLKNDGSERTLDQLRADVYLDLLNGVSPAVGPVLRAGAVELLVPLATLTGQSAEPGILAGYGPVVADIARQIAAQSGLGDSWLTTTAPPAGGVVAPAAPMQWRYRVVDDDGTLLFHGTTRARPQSAPPQDPRLPEPQSTGRAEPDTARSRSQSTAHGQPNRARQQAPPARQQEPLDRARKRPHETGHNAAHIAQPDSRTPSAAPPGERRQPCPPVQDDPTARYPNTRLRAWIAARDTTCRAPGCTAPARSSDVDHTVEHARGGLTTHDNLGLACRHHHRLKHEGGFHLEQPQPGRFRWISPTGNTYDVPPDAP